MSVRSLVTFVLFAILAAGTVIWLRPDHYGLSWPAPQETSLPLQDIPEAAPAGDVAETTTSPAEDNWSPPREDTTTPPLAQESVVAAVQAGAGESSCRVHHNRLFRWEHSGRLEGGHPYASSEEEAFSDGKLDHWLACNRERIPEADRAEIKRLVRLQHDGRIPGMTTVILHDDDRLETMMNGDELEDQVVVRLGRQQAAFRFEVDVNGHHYVFVLPTGCWNWSLGPAIAVPQAAVVDDCAIVTAHVEEGDAVRVAVSVARDARLPSTCWAQQVDGAWIAWPGECDDCSWVEAHSAVPDWRSRRIREPGLWVATERTIVLRVPRIVADQGYVGFCIERRGRRDHSHTIWVEPNDWHRPEYRYTVTSPWTW